MSIDSILTFLVEVLETAGVIIAAILSLLQSALAARATGVSAVI